MMQLQQKQLSPLPLKFHGARPFKLMAMATAALSFPPAKFDRLSVKLSPSPNSRLWLCRVNGRDSGIYSALTRMGSTNKESFNVAALNAEDKDAGKHSDVLENLSPSVRKRVDVLREIQSNHDDLEAKFFEERAALEAEYQKLYEPLYTKRYEIVNGVEVEVGATDAEPGEKGVPDFWLNAMKNNEVLVEEISERDEEALKFLRDIKWSRVDNPKGFKLDFYFDTNNPFFKNSVLTKAYHMIDEDEPILEKALGTEIEWLPGKCLTQKILKKKPKKGSKNAKPVTKIEKCESFFNFFSPPEVPEEEDDIDEEAAEELQNLMVQDYDVGCTIRDKIIPHAVSWFTGEAAEDEFDDVEEDEDDDSEDDEEEDDDDDEDENKTRKKKSGKTRADEW